MTILENYSLKKYNTFGIEVNTKHFVEINFEDELIDFLKNRPELKEKLFVIGGGSNILFTKNYDGTVLKYSQKGIEVLETNENFVLVKASAGEVWDDVVKYCVENNFYGIENLSLIPGTVGAAPIQNIGAYGVEFKDAFHSLECYEIESCSKKILAKDDCAFGYRDSIFKNDLKGKYVITSVTLKLNTQKSFNISYRALKDYFPKSNASDITLQKVSDAVREIRKSKLPDPDGLGNAGSFFKNPEIDHKQFLRLNEKYPDLVFHKVNEGYYKIPAGWLIEKCGFRGKRIGNVGCYKMQALIIVNYGNATGLEIKKFSELIRDKVYKAFKINLETEVNIL
jgi:UDP-N-acetylmuramate dehydrogenase